MSLRQKWEKNGRVERKAKVLIQQVGAPAIENNFASMIENILKPALNLLEHSEMSLIMIEYYLNFK